MTNTSGSKVIQCTSLILPKNIIDVKFSFFNEILCKLTMHACMLMCIHVGHTVDAANTILDMCVHIKFKQN